MSYEVEKLKPRNRTTANKKYALVGLCSILLLSWFLSPMFEWAFNYSKWHKLDIESYEIDVGWGGEDGSSPFGTGQSIDDLFLIAFKCLANPIVYCDIQYDDNYGYPMIIAKKSHKLFVRSLILNTRLC